MRKILSVVLALAMVASFGVLAFAEGSPVTETGSTTTEAAATTTAADTAAVVAPAVAANEVVAVPEIAEVTNEAGEAVEVTITPMSDVESLSEEDQEAFKAAYEEAMAIEDAVVEYFFWVSADEAVFPVSVKFACENEVVAVTCNGAECEFTAAEGTYSAAIPEAGAVAVLTAIAE